MSLRKLVLKEFKENLIEINYVYRLEDNKDVKFLKLFSDYLYIQNNPKQNSQSVYLYVYVFDKLIPHFMWKCKDENS